MRWPLSQPDWHPLDCPQDDYGETDPSETEEMEEENEAVRGEDDEK